MKKFLFLTVVFMFAVSVVAFAAESPAEVYSDISGKTIEEVYELRGDGTFGELAEKNGLYEEFKERMLESKKEILDKMVDEGTLTREKADEYIAEMEAHVSSEDGKTLGLGRELGFAFGRNGDFEKGQFANGSGYGLKDDDDRNHERLGQGNGQGLGQGRGLGQGNGRGFGNR